jgi:energy-coupling factor transport system permease protein
MLSNATRLNPKTWWLLAVALIIASTASHNAGWLFTVSLVSFATVLISSLRLTGEARTGNLRALRLYAVLAGAVFAIRVLFRVVFNLGFSTSDLVLLDLPRLAINLGIGEVQLLGPLSAQNLSAGAIDGLRLAAIILCVAMANIQANPRQLLKTMPGALFEIASTISVALNLAPQLIESLQRVRRARRLRGRSAGVTALPSLVIPVLEDTLERSLSLAASLDSRGFGRQTATQHPRIARVSNLVAVCLIAIGSYSLLTDSKNLSLAWGVLAVAGLCLAVALRLSSTRGKRTVYDKDAWSFGDLLALLTAALVVVATWAGVIS